MSKSPAFQFYPDKWIADTRRMTWKAKGLYHELLCVIWLQFQDTCSILNDDEYIASELGSSVEDWQVAKAEIMHPGRPLLQTKETNRLFSEGLWKEAVKQRDRREQLQENGRQGGRPKNQKVFKTKPTQQNSDNQTQSLPSPTPTPSSSPSPTPTVVNNSDVEWRQSLATNPAYTGIDVEREFGKASVWCEQNHRKCTRKFFINWLNRADKPMTPAPNSPMTERERISGLARRGMIAI